MKCVSQNNLRDAKNTLNRGGILAVPTETVYGLAVKYDNTAAIKKLLTMKNRAIGSGKVLTMMVADVDEMNKYVLMNRKTTNLARHYFPGELTLLLPKRRAFQHPYFDNFEKVGIRIPAHPYMLKLLRETGPLLVTSANPRGEAPCNSSEEIKERLPEVDLVVEGVSGGNLPSTIIDWTAEKPVSLRQGGLLIVRYA